MSNFCLTCDWLVNDKELNEINKIIDIALSCSCHLYTETQVTSDGYHVETFIISASSELNLEEFVRTAKEQTIFSRWVENGAVECPDNNSGLESTPSFILNPTYDAWMMKGRENKLLAERLNKTK